MIDFFVHYTENATEESFYGCILPHTCVYRNQTIIMPAMSVK